MMSERDPKKFDPARAHLLDAPERERYLPGSALVSLLELSGNETVVDYGAGTGRLSRLVAEQLTDDGQVIAVEESRQMMEHLTAQLSATDNARAVLIVDNRAALESGAAARLLAVNLLHEVRGERALEEMHRLLAPGGFALVIDWERAGGRGRDSGPPDELRYTRAQAEAEMRAAGLDTEVLDTALPHHFAIKGSA